MTKVICTFLGRDTTSYGRVAVKNRIGDMKRIHNATNISNPMVFTSDTENESHIRRESLHNGVQYKGIRKNVYVALAELCESYDEVHVTCGAKNYNHYLKLAQYLEENTGKKVVVY